MANTYICVDCGKSVTVATRKQTSRPEFRCRSCASKFRWANDATRPAPKTCPFCGKVFRVPQCRADSVYCSVDCKDAAHRVTKTCAVCGKEFTVSASTAARYNTCSIACTRKSTVYVTCKRCGKVFTGQGSKSRNYCSEECRRPPLMRTCKECGKSFRIVPSSATEGGIFCSFRCYRHYSGTQQESGLEAKVRQVLTSAKVSFEREYGVGKDCLLYTSRCV